MMVWTNLATVTEVARTQAMQPMTMQPSSWGKDDGENVKDWCLYNSRTVKFLRNSVQKSPISKYDHAAEQVGRD